MRGLKTADLSQTCAFVVPTPQERLQLYKKKVSKAAYDAELAGAKRTLAIDVAAANRFIDAAIPELDRSQKAALHQVIGKMFTEARC